MSKAERRSEFNQYYTADGLSQALVGMAGPLVSSVLEVGAGEGALIRLASQRWPTAKLSAFDLDVENVAKLKELLPESSSVAHLDAFSELANQELTYNGPFDLAIGNPPFSSYSIASACSNRSIYGFQIPKSWNTFRTELYFLLQSLNFIKKGGEVVYILPAGIICSQRYELIRNYLVSNFNVEEVREVDIGAFEHTEARTFLIRIRKGSSSGDVVLSSISRPDKKVLISNEKFIKRGDYSFYSSIQLIYKNTLSEAIERSFRGALSSKLLKESKASFVHTCDFDARLTEIYKPDYDFENDNSNENLEKSKFAIENDIVICRVGSRKVCKVGLIVRGQSIPSDCVFVLRPHSNISSRRLAAYLSSHSAHSYLMHRVKGVGAQYITLADLMGLPIPNSLLSGN